MSDTPHTPVTSVAPGELDLLRAYLRDRDVGCPVCKHNLRGAAGFACPECGGRLDLHVVSMDVPHKWWMTCVLAFALPLGLFGTLAAAGTYALVRARLFGPDRYLFGGCCAVALICAVNLALLFRRRTQFVQKPHWRQRSRAVLSCGMMAALALGLILLMIRSPFEWPWTLFQLEPMP